MTATAPTQAPSKDLLDQLAARLDPARVRRDELLAPYTTFKIGGPADLFFEATSADELAGALLATRELGVPYFVLGLGANGFHTNGYSLVRKILFGNLGLTPSDKFPDSEETIADVLLRVHRSDLASLSPLLHDEALHALAHITGGGIPENLDRVIPSGLCAVVRRSAWRGSKSVDARTISSPTRQPEASSTSIDVLPAFAES